MAPRVTSSSNRNKRKPAKPSRPALPPGNRGGALTTTTKPPTASRPQLPGAKPPARLPGGTGGADTVRGSGVRTGQPGAARLSLPAAKPPSPAAKPSTAAALRNTSALGRAAGAIAAAGAIPGQVMDVMGGFQRLANHPFITRMGNGEAPKGDRRTNRPGGGRTGRSDTTSDVTPTRQGPPVPARLRNAPTPPVLPTAVTRTSSGGSGSSTPRSGGSSPRSSAPARSSTPTAPAKPGQKFADFNPNRGTSKTNNPLMKDMIARMKAREDASDKTAGPTKDGKEYGQYLERQRDRNDNSAGPTKDGKTYGDYLSRRKKKS